MSFSGLKTASLNLIHNAQQKGPPVSGGRHRCIVAAGGVAANSIIRSDLQRACDRAGYRLYLPPLSLCGDNGAMIGAQGYYEYQAGRTAGLDLNAYATMELDDLFY